jgi:hypothetical protein
MCAVAELGKVGGTHAEVLRQQGEDRHPGQHAIGSGHERTLSDEARLREGAGRDITPVSQILGEGEPDERKCGRCLLRPEPRDRRRVVVGRLALVWAH